MAWVLLGGVSLCMFKYFSVMVRGIFSDVSKIGLRGIRREATYGVGYSAVGETMVARLDAVGTAEVGWNDRRATNVCPKSQSAASEAD